MIKLYKTWKINSTEIFDQTLTYNFSQISNFFILYRILTKIQKNGKFFYIFIFLNNIMCILLKNKIKFWITQINDIFYNISLPYLKKLIKQKKQKIILNKFFNTNRFNKIFYYFKKILIFFNLVNFRIKIYFFFLDLLYHKNNSLLLSINNFI